ncbi:nitroreductase [Paenibacillus sp. MER 99-2]|uniref:nitroreductase family protein n=1 Tax=Paenibacillus sp. MER 99-2 TaxID=2939572 RepID=UPI00203E2061|nr:nitroreductase [Paenibacillus sp. MER 99-2]MCM3170941.1 nitroreductase [Paenibacillus sp. MER 99-2]
MEVNQLTPVAQTITDRRTIRQFKSTPVPQELLLSLLNTANWAPNHGLREPWRYIQFSGDSRHLFTEAVLDALSADDRRRYEESRRAEYAIIPLHLIVVMKEDPRPKQWIEDFGAVCSWIQSFQLAAWEQGLGVVWKTNAYQFSPNFREMAGVQPGERIVGLLHIGYPEVIPQPRPRTAAEDKLTIFN